MVIRMWENVFFGQVSHVTPKKRIFGVHGIMQTTVMDSLLFAQERQVWRGTKTTMSLLASTHLCSKLIVEIIDMILRDVGPGHLQPLLTINNFFTLRRPYHTIVLHLPTNPSTSSVVPSPPPEPSFTTTHPRTRCKLRNGVTHTEPLLTIEGLFYPETPVSP